MNFAIGVIVFIIGILVSIGLHEVGHLAPAKRFGVKVPEYFVGFGPTLWSTRKGETTYGLKAIPLGGYVRLAGMYPPRPEGSSGEKNGKLTLAEEARRETRADLLPGEEHRAFSALSAPKKLTVMFGGPLMNWLIALVLLLVVIVGFGSMQPSATLSTVAECVSAVDEDCDPDQSVQAPGAAADLRPGDTVLSWNGTVTPDWESVRQAIRDGGTEPATVVVDRDGEEVTLTVTATSTERPVAGPDGQAVVGEDGQIVTEMVPYVGIGPAFEMVRGTPAEAVGLWWEFTLRTGEAVISVPGQLVSVVGSMFGAEPSADRSIISIVGVGAVAGDIVSADVPEYTVGMRIADMLSLLASLNLALFVFNLIPLPPLDGGHIAGALVEGARRTIAKVAGKPDPGPVDTARLLPVAYAVVGLLLLMTVVLIWADLTAPIL